MPYIAVMQLLPAFAGMALSLLAVLFRRFGPASWVLALFLLPAALTCAALAAPRLWGLSPEESLKIAYSLLILTAPGGLLASYTIDRADYLKELKRKRISAGVILIAAPCLLGALYFAADIPMGKSALPPGTIALGRPGFFSALYLLLVSVISLANLEQTLRSAEEHVRWEIKYLLIGLAASYGAIVFTASKVLIYPSRSGFLVPEAMELFPIVFSLSCILIYFSWRRSSGRARVIVSHGVIYGTVTLLSVGLYLIASSLVARWAAQWGRPGLPAQSLVFLLSLLGLAILVLATTFRHRVRRWIRRNLLAGRYDYRRFWLEATESIQSIDPLQKCAAALVDLVHRSLGALDISVWIRLRDPNRLQMLSARGSIADSPATEVFGVVEELLQATTPVEVLNGKPAAGFEIDPAFLSQTKASLLVPLVSSGRFIGLLTVGPDRSGKPFDWQAQEFLSVLASHAAGEFHKSDLLSTLVEAKETEAFRTFSTFLLHDLKNFASTLSLIAGNATRHQSNPEFHRDAFQSVFETAERMKRLCNNLRTFSAAPAPNKKFADLNSLVRTVARNFDAGLSKHLTMNFGELPPVLIDAEEMERVIQNLLLNALEALSPQGKIALTTQCAGPNVEIVITDDGRGMTEEFLENGLFLPFHTTKSDGLGIGLFQSKKIIEAHNGAIWVKSGLGSGTTVRISIPMTPTADQSGPLSPSEE
jgi:putative PEP-CTERM system histidine kinase